MALQSTTISSYSNNHMHNSVTCNSNSKGTLTRASLAVICLPFAFAFASLVPSAFISYTSSYSRSGEVYYHCDDEQTSLIDQLMERRGGKRSKKNA